MTSLFRRSILFAVMLVFAGSLASCSEDSTGPETKKPLLTGPSSVNFGGTAVGNCKDTTIRYDNTTGKSITLSSATFTGAGFTWIGTALPAEVAAGASIDLKVRFCPIALDTAKATLVFKGTGGEDVNVQLIGFSSGRSATLGSTYTFSTFLTDGDGVKQPGTDDVETHTITGVNQFFAGKPNVTVSSSGQGVDYFAFEANGNISTYLPTEVPVVGSLIGGWRELPFGTKAQNVVLIEKDTAIEVPQLPGIPIPVTVKQVASYTGTSSITVLGTTYTVENVTLVTTVVPSLPLGALTVTVNVGYVPAVGYLGTYNTTSVSTFQVLPIDEGISKKLTSFEIE
ncbi:MAG TPA: hypothetical protein VFH43_08995 [Candidatus Kapabacteria bacterium]|nr:hypothetical protein [Candidatus Kapabacteria bacterium]